MSDLVQDLRYGAKMLRGNPGVTAVAVFSLAIGIGANTASFSLANALLLRPLPVVDSDRLVSVFTSYDWDPSYRDTSYPDYIDLRDGNDVFSGLAAQAFFPMSLGQGGRAEVVLGYLVTADYFPILGVEAALGRTFLPEENRVPDGSAVAVISHTIWERRFASDPKVVGESISINGHSFTVIGVAPRGYTGLNAVLVPDVWVPLAAAPKAFPYPVSFDKREDPWLKIVGRLAPGVSVSEAQASMEALAANLAKEHPHTNQGQTVRLLEVDKNRLVPNGDTSETERIMAILMGVVGLVLLIACFNVASLHLTRATQRQREIAMRRSLGASRGRVVRQLLTESVLLSLLAGGVGFLVAVWAVDLIFALEPPSSIPIQLDLSPDLRVLGFTMLVSLFTGLIFGLAPATQMIRPGRFAALRAQSVAGEKTLGRAKLQSTFVAAQVGVALVLLISAGLFLKSMTNLLAVDPGFDLQNGLIVPINLGFSSFDEDEGRRLFHEIVERVEALPGVESAALSAFTPLGQLHGQTMIEVEGYQPRSDESLLVGRNIVDVGYFETMGIPVLAGRAIDERDGEDRPAVVVVNEAMVRRFWPGHDPIGRRIYTHDAWREVVGVVRDGRYDALQEPPQPYFFIAMRQEYVKQVDLVVAAAGDPSALTPLIQREIRRLAPDLAIHRIYTVEEHLNSAVGTASGPALWVGIFGALALVLAWVGVYGVTAYSVSQRTQEIGIRMALGAQRGNILKMVLSRGLKMALIGVGGGLVLAFAVTRVLSSLLYEVGALDVTTFVAIPLGLIAAVSAACYVPARKAARVDPVVALRYE